MDPEQKQILEKNLVFFADRIDAFSVIHYSYNRYPDIISYTDQKFLLSPSLNRYTRVEKLFSLFTKNSNGYERLYTVLEATEHSASILETLNPARYCREHGATSALLPPIDVNSVAAIPVRESARRTKSSNKKREERSADSTPKPVANQGTAGIQKVVVPKAREKTAQKSQSVTECMQQMLEKMNAQEKMMKEQGKKYDAMIDKQDNLAKDVKDLRIRVDSFIDTIEGRMNTFETKLMSVEKALEDKIEGTISTLKADLESLNTLYKSLEEGVLKFENYTDIIEPIKSFGDKVSKLCDEELPQIKGVINELCQEFSTLKSDTISKMHEFQEQDGQGDDDKVSLLISRGDPVSERDVRGIASKVKSIWEQLAESLEVKIDVSKGEKCVMDVEGCAEAVLTEWIRKGEKPTWGELYDKIDVINSEMAENVFKFRKN